jgi:uncharacterized membrane protein YesL
MAEITITHILLIIMIASIFVFSILIAYALGYFNGISTGITIELYNHTISNYNYIEI